MVTALVTGGAQRIGRELVLSLARHGYDVAIHCHSSVMQAEETADEVRAVGRRAGVFPADLLNLESLKSLIPAVNREMGSVSVLINNASIFEADCIHSACAKSWERHINSNLRAPFFLTQIFAEQCAPLADDVSMEPLGALNVINMIDQRVVKPRPDFMTYTLAKAGLWWLTRTSAQGLAPRIRVNAIAPGPTLKGSRQSDSDFRDQQKSTLLQSGPELSEIGEALEFLLKSRSVTGQMICVDGGQHLLWETADVLIQE